MTTNLLLFSHRNEFGNKLPSIFNFKLKRVGKITMVTMFLLSAYSIKQQIGELTASSLGLKVDIFEPEKEFKKDEFQIFNWNLAYKASRTQESFF